MADPTFDYLAPLTAFSLFSAPLHPHVAEDDYFRSALGPWRINIGREASHGRLPLPAVQAANGGTKTLYDYGGTGWNCSSLDEGRKFSFGTRKALVGGDSQPKFYIQRQGELRVFNDDEIEDAENFKRSCHGPLRRSGAFRPVSDTSCLSQRLTNARRP